MGPKLRRSREEDRRDAKEKMLGKNSPVARLKKREGRSTSCDSSGSKDSLPAGARRSRKTKEAAKNYLNMLGQELASSKPDDDAISIESFSSAAQEKRLEEFEKEEKLNEVKNKVMEVVTSKKENKEDLEHTGKESPRLNKKSVDKTKTCLKKRSSEKNETPAMDEMKGKEKEKASKKEEKTVKRDSFDKKEKSDK